MAQSLLVLENAIQPYAWGSRTAIAAFLGRPTPSPGPEAELWIGAHPKAPSRVVTAGGSIALDRLIAADPGAILGPEVSRRFGGELPFLFKLLAAAEPLSIQAHPNAEQARAGFLRENVAGVPLDSPRRSYRDPNHKPELVCALSPFDALEGFRAGAEIARALEPLAGPELCDAVGSVGSGDPEGLRALLRRLLTLPAVEAQAVLARASEAAERRAGGERSWLWVSRLLRKYPSDMGALAPLYLNLVTLQPGEALYLPAGQLHAYLGGTALELMANSDNVLRGGLTAKHVDVAELLSTLVFEPRQPDILPGDEIGPGERVYRTPAREFELWLVEVAPGRAPVSGAGGGPQILLGLEGDASIRAGAATASLSRGQAVLVPASLAAYELEGLGRIACARIPARR